MKMAVYAGGAIIAFIWLRAQANDKSVTEQAAADAVNTVVEVAKGVGDALGTSVVKPAADAIKSAVSKPFKVIYSGVELEFLMSVEGLGGIKISGDREKKIALEYLNGVAQAVDSVPLLGLWSATNAYRAAQAVKEYRSNIGKYQQWGIF
jgi:hypothetical protein